MGGKVAPIAVVAVVIALPILGQNQVSALGGGTAAAAIPTTTLVPESLRTLFNKFGGQCDVATPALLAGVANAESSLNPGIGDSAANAQGLMQITPDTAGRHGKDGDGDGKIDVKASPSDAVATAANVLCSYEKDTRSVGGNPIARTLAAYLGGPGYVANGVPSSAQEYIKNVTDFQHSIENLITAAAPTAAAKVEQAITWAKAHTAGSYVYGADGPNAWDCSSYVRAAFKAAGIDLPRTAEGQRQYAIRHGRLVPWGQFQRGDLVFHSTSLEPPNEAGHVLIVLDPAQKLSLQAQSSRTGIGVFPIPDCSRKTLCETYRLS